MRARNQVLVSFALLFSAPLLVATCGPSSRDNGDGCTSICSSLGYQKCHDDGTFEPAVTCGPDEICDPEHGCVACVPDSLYCFGPTANDVYKCNSDGTDGTLVEMCK